MTEIPTDPSHIVLIGMMGVGKSTVGRRIARELHRPFLDSDDAVVARTGRPVTEIFATDGEATFREIEASVMDELLSDATPSVIAAAGGSILSPATRSKLDATGIVIWMRAPVDVLVGRTSRGTHRPALATDPLGTLTRMESDREDLYAEVADITVDCTRSITEVVASILDAVQEASIR